MGNCDFRNTLQKARGKCSGYTHGKTKIIFLSYLGRPEGKRRRLYVCFFFVHEQKAVVLHETQVFPGCDVAESERLAPPDVASTPPDKNSEDLKGQQPRPRDKRRFNGPLHVPPH